MMSLWLFRLNGTIFVLSMLSPFVDSSMSYLNVSIDFQTNSQLSIQNAFISDTDSWSQLEQGIPDIMVVNLFLILMEVVDIHWAFYQWQYGLQRCWKSITTIHICYFEMGWYRSASTWKFEAQIHNLSLIKAGQSHPKLSKAKQGHHPKLSKGIQSHPTHPEPLAPSNPELPKPASSHPKIFRSVQSGPNLSKAIDK